MNRRNVLKSMLAAATLAAINHPVLAATNPRKVVVIGAGMAGLAAASRLARAGHQVTVLEGRDRLGGRTWTSERWADAPVDLGASWIHGLEGNPLTALASEAGADLLTTSYDSTLDYDVGGQPMSDERAARLEALKTQVERAIRKGQQAGTDRPLRQTIEQAFDWPSLAREDRELLNFIINSTVEQEYAGSANQQSTYWFDSSDGYEGDDAVFAQGYRVLVNYLAKGLDIRLAQVVSAIHSEGAGVRVTTDKGIFTADKVIVTVPLGVLKRGAITFSPALPARKQAAIQALGMGNFNKCYLRFPTRFWPQQDWLEYVDPLDQHGVWSQWLNLARLTGQPILLGFNAGDYGGEIEGLTDEAIVAGAMHRLRGMFGTAIPEPVDYQITRWSSDPFSFGGYSFNAVGSAPVMRDHLAEPVNGQIFFAGEATHRQMFATVHGALLSGQRAADEAAA